MARVRPVGHEERLSLVEHLDELRSRLIVCVLAFIVCPGVTYWQNGNILEWVNEPLETTQNLECEKPAGDDTLEQSSCYQLRSGLAFDALQDSMRSLDGALRGLRGAEGLPAGTQQLLTAA